MKTSTEKTTERANSGHRPDWVVKVPRTQGKKSGLVRIGAAWDREDGGICLRLTGNQIVSGDIYIYPAIDAAS